MVVHHITVALTLSVLRCLSGLETRGSWTVFQQLSQIL